MNIDVMGTLLLILLVVVLQLPVWWKVLVLQRRARQHEATLKIIADDIRALSAKSANMNEYQLDTEQQLRRLADRQQEHADFREPVPPAYNHAIKLAQRGVSIDELMAACGLVRGEAELLIRLHRLN